MIKNDTFRNGSFRLSAKNCEDPGRNIECLNFQKHTISMRNKHISIPNRRTNLYGNIFIEVAMYAFKYAIFTVYFNINDTNNRVKNKMNTHFTKQ